MAELLDFVSPRFHFLLLFLLSFLVMETHQQLETEVWSVQLHCDQLAKFDRSYSKQIAGELHLIPRKWILGTLENSGRTQSMLFFEHCS
uniref:Secreted protein n=1 Tax=Physcomitrium patens TaxID=3218 RepID=A0A2K1IH40_PHYPA|nr:hypothetical protein PHYPA_029187 [Physcomitrium patens]